MMNNSFRLLPKNHPFIVDEFNIRKEFGNMGKAIDIHVVQFNPRYFEDKMFDMTHVHCPIVITKSISKRKAEYFSGRYLIARRLQELGFPHQALEPNFDRSPQLPSGAIGSISHSQDLACIAVLPSCSESRDSIGIDIQHLIPSKVCADIENIVATIHEFIQVQRLGLTHSEAVTLLFSAKESIYKALARFVVKGLDFDSATLISIGKDTIQFKLSQQISSQLSKFKGDNFSNVTCNYKKLAPQEAFLTVCYP